MNGTFEAVVRRTITWCRVNRFIHVIMLQIVLIGPASPGNLLRCAAALQPKVAPWGRTPESRGGGVKAGRGGGLQRLKWRQLHRKRHSINLSVSQPLSQSGLVSAYDQ